MTGIGPPSSTYDPNASNASSAPQDPSVEYAAFMANYGQSQHPHPLAHQHPQHQGYGLGMAVGMGYDNGTLGENVDVGNTMSVGQDMYSGAGANPMFYHVQQQQSYDALPTPTQTQHGYHHNQQHSVPTSQFDFELPRQQQGYQTQHQHQHQHPHQHSSFTDLDYANAQPHGTASVAGTVASSTPRTSNTPTVSGGTPPVSYDYHQNTTEYYQQPQAHQQTSYVQPQTQQQRTSAGPGTNAHWPRRAPIVTSSAQKPDVHYSNVVSPLAGTEASSPIGPPPATAGSSATSKGEVKSGSRRRAADASAGNVSTNAKNDTPPRAQKHQAAPKSRKRARPTPAEDSGSDDDDDEDGIFSGHGGAGGMSNSWMLNMPNIPGLRFGVESSGGASRL